MFPERISITPPGLFQLAAGYMQATGSMRARPGREQQMSIADPTPDKTVGVSLGSNLLETKLYARPARASLVSRPRITKLLDRGLSASLILVSAPAGFGKT